MAKNTNDTRPVHGITVRKYDEFAEDCKAFAEGRYNFMMVLGHGGIGKTETARRIMPDAIVIDTRVTAFALYQLLYFNIGRDIIIDDVQDLYNDTTAVSLLKALTETRKVKTVSWHTASTSGGNGDGEVGEGIPASFETTSRVLLIANKWSSASPHVRALESRADVTIEFDPSPYEVHKSIGTGGWFHDKDVYDFMYSILPIIKEPSFRTYLAASRQRAAKRPWRDRVLEWILGDDETAKAVVDVLLDKKLKTVKAQRAAFTERSGMADRTFQRRKKDFVHLVDRDGIGANPKLVK